MLSIILIVSCIGAILVIVSSIVTFVLISLNDPERVSDARQGWIWRRSEKDTDQW